MQMYRINYRLLFAVVATSLFVGGVCFFFLHPWQVNRKATWFHDRAEQALAEGDLREAYDYQYKYVRYRADEDDARIKLAQIAVDISESSDATGEDLGTAYHALEETIRRTDDPGLRKKLADILMVINRPQDALVHIDILLQNEPENTLLQAQRVRALFATKDFRNASKLALGLIGYDEKTDEFDSSKGSAADQPEVYALLAETLYNDRNTQELARRVVDQMIEANPDSFDAHLKRSVLLYRINEQEESEAALAKAYELAPTELAVLRRKGHVALSEKDLDSAEEFFAKAMELYPDNLDLYQLLAQTNASQNKFDEALAVIDRGVARFDDRLSATLVFFKISLLLAKNEIAAAEEEIEALSRIKGVDRSRLDPLVDYQRARVKFQQKNWQEAAKELRRVRPLLLSHPKDQAFAGILLGQAYEKLGKPDLALESYNLVLQNNPGYELAAQGARRVRTQLSPDEQIEGFNLNQLVKAMLARPENEQDWAKVDEEIATHALENNTSDVRLALMRAQVFLERKMYSDAKRLIREAAAADPESLNVRFAAVKLLAMDPSEGPEKALAQLDKIVDTVGTSLNSRVLRTEILATLGGEDLPEKLHALTEGTDQWSDAERAQLFSNIGIAFQRLKMAPEANEYWGKAANLSPNSLPTRMHLFEMALQQRDEALMKDAQEKVLEIVGSKNDASYILTEVKRRMIGFSQEKSSREELLSARTLLDAALQQRPEWSDLHVLYGQLLVVLNEDMEIALEHLDKALEFGPANMNALGLQVQLLFRRGLHAEARARMEKVPPEARRKVFGAIEAEVLMATGEKQRAFEVAQEIAAEQSEVPKTQQWFATLAQQAGQTDEAVEALQLATKLSPSDSANWTQLLSLYVAQQDPVGVWKTIQSAQLALDAEFLPLLTAKSYELQGDWRPAERIYLAVFDGRFEEVAVARRMADFYLLWAQADPTNIRRAGQYINHILRAGYEGKIPANHPQVAWARNRAAGQLARTGDYQNAAKAQRLLAQGAVDGVLSVKDQTLLAEILSSLRDPDSQGKAIQMLSDLHQKRLLQKKNVLLLAQLLRNANEWKRCEDLMLDALSTFGSDPQVWSTYISMLIDRGDFSDARRYLGRLKNLDSQGAAHAQLQAQLAAKQGNKAQVRKSLAALLPNLKGALDANQLRTIYAVAQLATQCEDYELADKLFERYVKRVPQAAFERVKFQALYGDASTAIAAMKEEFPLRMDDVLMLTSQMMRKRRPEFGDQFDEDVNRMVAAAVRDDPDSAQRLLYRAEILEIQQKYQESAAAYDQLVARTDVPVRILAAAKNNLAFLLATLGERLDDAERLVNESMEYFGPIDDLLDTRAIVRLASKKHDLAIEDLQLAVSVGRDPIKYFHLAKAQLAAGDEEGATKSWNEAKQLNLKKEALPLLEQPSYDEIQARLDQSDRT